MASPIAPEELDGQSFKGLAALPTASEPAAPDLPAETHVALLEPAPDQPQGVTDIPPSAIRAFEADKDGEPIWPGICAIDQLPQSNGMAAILPQPVSATTVPDTDFGLRLAKAAEQQADRFVIYDDEYRTISYPMGDVNPLFGVCTDVVIRAYRALGLDLQVLVREARVGQGDPSIDHRRTDVLRKFFATRGKSLPITSFPEDYLPGDIVTYYRTQSRGSRGHIAVVSSIIAPSGRPMIVHNRAWGPQLEDALFVNPITGHYRYAGPSAPPIRNAQSHPPGAPLPDKSGVVATSLRAPQ
jgi:uncharacterized protein YijF (DUF1287 family)